jgi:hypothetical protein
LIHAITAILALANDGAVATTIQPSDERISPVKVTAKKLPDLGDPYEMQVRKHEKLEAETREIERAELATHRAKWNEKQVSNYRFTVSRRGAWYGTYPIVVTVRAGQMVSSEFVVEPASETTAANAEPYDTIPNLFAFIGGLLNHPMSLPRVQYDTQYGFPVHISNDVFAISDDEFSVQVWDFQLLE